MDVFMSWSGDYSRAIAEALSLWLPNVVQQINPIFSQELEKGARSIEEINSALEGTRFGIICLTPDNLQSPWIHYEAGALAKTKDARIWTVLRGLDYADVAQPLAQFQHTVTRKDDMSRLIRTINASLPQPVAENRIVSAIDKWWADLETKLLQIDSELGPRARNKKNIRDNSDVLNEILTTVREIRRSQPVPTSRLASLPKLSDFDLQHQHVGSNKLADDDIDF
jgi:hypothetical protein